MEKEWWGDAATLNNSDASRQGSHEFLIVISANPVHFTVTRMLHAKFC
jgi:hypothetical protein